MSEELPLWGITLPQPFASAAAMVPQIDVLTSWSRTYRYTGAVFVHSEPRHDADRVARDAAGIASIHGSIPLEFPRGTIVGVCRMVRCSADERGVVVRLQGGLRPARAARVKGSAGIWRTHRSVVGPENEALFRQIQGRRIVVVTGGRDYRLTMTDHEWLAQQLGELRPACMFHGACKVNAPRNADWDCDMVARHMRIAVARFPMAGREGPKRNAEMCRLAAMRPSPVLLAFPGGDGTASCVAAAEKYGLEIRHSPECQRGWEHGD